VSGVSIRLAVPADVPAMQQIFREAGALAWAHIFSEEGLAKLNPPVRWAEAVVIQTPERPQVLVAEQDGAVVGFAVIRQSPDPDCDIHTGELDSFYTHPDVWGQGAGRELLQAATDLLREQGYRRAKVWTAELNHRPRQVYEAAGWQLDGASRKRTVHETEFVELRYGLSLM
jgi:GNAT superfamily N-acetyltransferase